MDPTKRAMRRIADTPSSVPCKIGAGPDAEFLWKVRVYYEDTDLGGVVYHANYLRFMERARTEWLRSLGFEQDVLRERHAVLFVVADAAVTFRRPARFNDALEVSVQLERRRAASLVFHQEVRAAGMIFCTAEIRVACIDADTFTPKPLPSEILREFPE